MHSLLAILEVEQSSGVICQAEGCGRHIHKRIHVVSDQDKIIVLGSGCYRKIYLGEERAVSYQARYTDSSEGRKLSPEEVQLLIEQTNALVAQFEREHLNRARQQQPVMPRVALSNRVEAHRQPAQPAQPGPDSTESRDVKCHYCHGMMQTTSTRPPAMGYKCALCLEFSRPMPSRFGVSAEQNARANLLDAKGRSG